MNRYINSFEIQGEIFYYYDIKAVMQENKELKKLPVVLKILLEANLRNASNENELYEIINIFKNKQRVNIKLYPSRVIMQDYTGVSVLVDLASMRDSFLELGKNVEDVNPKIIVDLVVDHSLDIYTNEEEYNFDSDIEKEYELNKEKYQFIKWAQNSFDKLRVVPPGSGICHQVNLEYLSTILHLKREENKNFIYPETLIGTDSHAPMINSLGVLGWKVNEIQAKTSILGMPVSLTLPQVVGVNIHGKLKEGVTSSDLVLTLTSKLKECNIKGKLVEFHGNGLKHLTLEDRSTIANMAPEYEAVCSFFTIDDKTIDYFNKTRDNEDYGYLLKEYLQRQELFYSDEVLEFDEVINFDLEELEPAIAGPNKVHTHIKVEELKEQQINKSGSYLKDLDVVIASITSCTTTSNPYLILHAALVAKKAYEFGLHTKEYVKTSFSPGSLAIKEFLKKLDLLKYLEHLGFYITGYACELFGNLEDKYEFDIKDNKLDVCSLTSGSKNFQNRLHPLINYNYLSSPSLVVIYSIVGTTKFDLFEDVISTIDDKDIYLKDLWSSSKEVGDYMSELDYTLYKDIYKDIFKGNEFWQNLEVENTKNYKWNDNSTYIQASMFYTENKEEKLDIHGARLLALFDDNITTEQISPMGQIPLYSTASKYLEEKGIKSFEYNTFGSRKANAKLMIRGIFEHPKLKNRMVSKESAYTFDYENNEIVSIYEKSQKFKDLKKPLVVVAGHNFGMGKQKEWASKGMNLLGVKVIIAKSFDEKYRKDLIAYGILPLEFIDDDIDSLKLKGDENLSFISDKLIIEGKIKAYINRGYDEVQIDLKVRIDTKIELEYYKNGGIFPFLFNSFK
ncbi:aconitate hydratase [Arcobacter sp. CECT 8983]|uniref:aconitate hydratase AcnA n=2 Tax=unclassified Arcobacter TaxID=2593671 RepID=UPI00100B5D23|nr:aconitate hydratase AcnA [Arcobacter sp. CECT 8983]RXJ89070.1 aconitate hydratase [Arcobacter sp. CECT 8983]